MEFIQEFKNYLFSQKKQPSKLTVKNYVADVKKFIAWIEARLNRSFLPQLTTKELIQDYKSHQSAFFSASSLDRQMSSLKKFFEFLKLEGKIGTNPFEAETVKQPVQDPWHLKEFKDFLYVYNASHLTIKNYIIDVKQFFAWAEQVAVAEDEYKLSNKNILSKLNDEMIEEYSQRLLHNGNFSPASINRKLSSLRKYLTWAHAQGFLSAEVTTLPANVTSRLLNEADSVEENAKTAVDTANSSLDFAQGVTGVEGPADAQRNEVERASAGGNDWQDPDLLESISPLEAQESVENLSSEAVKTYSKIPPVRLFQKLSALASLGLEYAVVIPLAHAAAQVRHRVWILKGKPLFTRTDVKLPEKPKPFRSRVKNISKSFYNPWGISIAHFPLHKKVFYHIQYTRPAWYRRYSRLPAARYFNFAILMIFCAMIGFGLYSTFFSNARKSPSLASGPTAPPRVLSFQGRLTDTNDNPITTANTHLRFAIYDDATASGSALLWQEVDDVSPDTDGDFSTILGNNSTIAQTVFAQHNALWLGVTVENTDELQPRQQIATVAFASNSETLQGLPPLTPGAVGAGANANTVLVLDSGGNLDLGQVSTTIQSSSGQFTLSGKTLTLTTATGSNTNIELSPDGSGIIDLQKPVQNSTLNNNIPSAAGSVEVDDLLSVLATSSGQSAFTINQNSTGPLISASTSGIAKFTVDNSGNTFAAGNVTGQTIYTGGGVSYYINNAISNLYALTLANNLTVSGNVDSNLVPATTDTYDLGSDPSAGGKEWRNLYVKNLVINGSAFAQYWQLNNSVISPAITTNDFAVGGISTSSAAFQVFATGAGAQPAGTASTSGNFTFNGTTNPAKINLLNGASLGFYSATSGKGDAGLNSTPTLYVANAGNVGVGNNNPSYSLDVTGNLRVTSAGGFGGALPGATVQGQTSSLAVTGYTGLGGLRINGANTTDTIYNGTNNIILTRDAGGYLGLTQTSTPSIGLLVNTSTGGVGINTNTTGIGNAQLVINQSNLSGLGDVIAASAAGSTVFKVTNNGDVTGSQFVDLQDPTYFLDPNNSGTSLKVAGGIGVGGATPTDFKVQVAGNVGPDTTNMYNLGADPNAAGKQWANIYGQNIYANGILLTQLWQENLGALSPLHITDDFLLGATSTSSAKFAVTNIASGIPTASLSAGLNSGTYLTANGTLATSALQSLTLGDSNTGNINIGTNATSQAITLGGTSQTGSLILGQSTASNTINIGNTNPTAGNTQTINIGAGSPVSTGKTTITVGNNLSNSSLALVAGNGNMTLTGSTGTNYTIGDTTSTGALTLGQSTAGQAINIGNAINTVGQVIQIANGNSAGNSDVDILSGNGTSGTGTIHIGDNPRVTTLTLGNVAPANARTTTIAGGNSTQNDTVNILNGAPSANTQTVNILAGTATGGTQALNLGSSTSTTTIKGTNFTAGGVAYAASNTLNFVTGSDGQCLLSHGTSNPTFGLCTFGNTNYWNLQQGALFPINTTLDFLIGGSSTGSAQFAVTHMAAGTPQASVSATATGTGITLGGDGSIQSLINGTLTIGGNSTGNIVLKPSNGVSGTVTLSGYGSGILHSNGSGLLTSSAVDLASSDVTNTLRVGNGGIGQSSYTNGDMLYYDSSTPNVLTELHIGADNSILNVDSTTHKPVWTSTPTLSSLTVTGTTTLSTLASSVAGGSGTVLNPTTNGTLDLGDSTHYFGTIYAKNLITPVGNGTQGFWQLTNNVISPVNSFYDLAVGGSATGSATPWQVFGTTVGVNTAGTATSSAGLTFRGSSTSISQLNGNDLVFQTSPGGDAGLSTVLTIGGNKNVTVANDLAVNGSNLTTSTTNFNLFPTNVTTLNFASVVSTLNIGRGSSSTNLNGNLVLGTPASGNTLAVNGGFISSLIPNADNTYDLGANGFAWRNAYINNVFASAAGGTQGFWQLNSNVLSPTFNWNDLAIGGTSTSSAKFNVFANAFTFPAGPFSFNDTMQTVQAGSASSSGGLSFTSPTSSDIRVLNGGQLRVWTSHGGDIGLGGAAGGAGCPAFSVLNNDTYVGGPAYLNSTVAIGCTDTLSSGAGAALTVDSQNSDGINISGTLNGDGGYIQSWGSTALQLFGGFYNHITNGNYYATNGVAGSGKGSGVQFDSGTTAFFNNTGLTSGIQFTPTTTLQISAIGKVSIGNTIPGNGQLVINQTNNSGLGDIFSASAAGTTEFTIKNDGTINNSLIPSINNTYNLGSDPTLGGKEWDTLYVRQVVTPSGTVAADYWQLSINGTLAPINSAYDLVIGGNSTSSAKFQVFSGSYAGNPGGTASMSGNLTFNGAQTPQKIQLLNGADLGFYSASSGQGDAGLGSTPSFYIKNNGSIGIGTNTPLTSSGLDIEKNSLGNAAQVVNQLGLGDIFTASVSGTTKFVITNSGNVGIGTSTPGGLLHLASASIGGTQLKIENDDTGGHVWKLISTGTGNTSGAGFLTFSDETANATRMVIDTNGSVGIGTTNPLTSSGIDIEKNSLGNALVLLKQLGSAGDLLVASNSAGALQFKFDASGILTANSFLDNQNTNYFLDPAATGNSASIAGSLTFTKNPTNINLLNGADHFNFQNSPGGDAGLGSNIQMYAAFNGRAMVGYDSSFAVLEGASGHGIKLFANSGTGFAAGQVGLEVAGTTGYVLIGTTTTNNAALVVNQNNNSGLGDIFTASSAGSTKFVISNAGNVGIGTTSPSSLLHVQKGSTGFSWTPTSGTVGIFEDNTDGRAFLTLVGKSTGQSELWFADESSQNQGRIRYDHTNDSMSLWTNASQQVTINSSGNVGIGTTGPNNRLDILGGSLTAATQNTYALAVANSNGTQSELTLGSDASNTYIQSWNSKPLLLNSQGNSVAIGTTSTSANGILTVQGTSGTSGKGIMLFVNDTAIWGKTTGGTSTRLLFIGADDDTRINAASGQNIKFRVNETDVATIGPTGRFDAVGYRTRTGTGGSYGNNYFNSNWTGGGCLEFYIDGTRVVANANGCSDQRLKTNITTYADPLSSINQLNPVTFNWNPDADMNDTTLQSGFIAQQVAKVFPNLVSQTLPGPLTPDGTYTVNYLGLISPAIGAIQELSATQSAHTAALANLTLNTTGDIAITQATPSTDFTVPHYYTLSDALGHPISQMGGFVELVVGNLRAGSIQAQQTITNSLAVATDNVSIGGQSLRDYVIGIVNQVLQNTPGIGSNSSIATTDQLRTNLVSPLASDSAVAIDLQNSKVSVKNTNSGATVAEIDNVGNATFSGTLTGQNLAVNGDATVSGTLHAGKIVADEIEGLQAAVGTLSAQTITNVTNIYMSSGSGSQNGENSTTGSGNSGNNSNSLLTQSGGYTNLASFSAYLSYVPNLHATTGMFDQGLISLGPTTLTDTSVTGTLSVDTNLTIADNSINVLGADLQIQPFKQGGVAFENGLVAIDTSGNLTVNGKAFFNGGLYASTIFPVSGQDLNIQLGDASTRTSEQTPPQLSVKNASGSGVFAINQLGDIVASGAANIAKLNFNFVQPAMALSDIEVVATGSAGTAAVKQYQTQLTIDNKNVTPNSLIYITPVGNTVSTPYLMRQVPGTSFTVGIQVPSSQPVNFNWLIVN